MEKDILNDLKDIPKNKRLAIIGGSFDPPHLGHQLLITSVLSLENIDHLLVIPCYDHAFNKKSTAFEHRVKMCEESFRFFKNVSILQIEKFLPKPSYTINTLRTIRTFLPSKEITFTIGSDAAKSIDKWHEAKSLVDEFNITIFERENYPLDNLPAIAKKANIHTGVVLTDFSSTAARNIISNNHDFFCHFVDKKVCAYVEKNNLYKL